MYFLPKKVSTRLLFDGLCSKLKRCWVQHKNTGNIPVSQKLYRYYSRSKKEHNEAYFYDKFYFEFANDSKVLLLFKTPGMIVSNE